MTPEQEDAIENLLDYALARAYEQGALKHGLDERGFILLTRIKLLLGKEYA